MDHERATNGAPESSVALTCQATGCSSFGSSRTRYGLRFMELMQQSRKSTPPLSRSSRSVRFCMSLTRPCGRGYWRRPLGFSGALKSHALRTQAGGRAFRAEAGAPCHCRPRPHIVREPDLISGPERRATGSRPAGLLQTSLGMGTAAEAGSLSGRERQGISDAIPVRGGIGYEVSLNVQGRREQALPGARFLPG
jgi:hypothetical protein